jgi:hypothetical protein
MTHPLTAARWAVSSIPEHGTVLLADIHKIDRACTAIGVIARVAGNNVAARDQSDTVPLNDWTVSSLLGGIESLCEYVNVLTEDMIEQATTPSSAALPSEEMPD